MYVSSHHKIRAQIMDLIIRSGKQWVYKAIVFMLIQPSSAGLLEGPTSKEESMIRVQTVEKEQVYRLACLIPSSKLVSHDAFSLVSPSLQPTHLLVYLVLQSNSCEPLLHDCIEHVWEFYVRPVCRPASHRTVSLSLYLHTFVVSCGKYTSRLNDIVQSATGSLDAHLLIQISQMRRIHLA